MEKNILQEKADELAATLGEIEMGVLIQGYTLADAIREGSSVTNQKHGGWYDAQGNACALSAAYVALQARGIVK